MLYSCCRDMTPLTTKHTLITQHRVLFCHRPVVGVGFLLHFGSNVGGKLLDVVRCTFPHEEEQCVKSSEIKTHLNLPRVVYYYFEVKLILQLSWLELA